MNRLLLVAIILLSLYIVSPWDFYPALLDDFLILPIILLLWNKLRQRPSAPGHQQTNKESGNQTNQPHHKRANNLDQARHVLGCSTQAGWEEIKQAYRRRLSENHPDKVNHLSSELKQRAHEVTQSIQAAYDLLKNHYQQ